jgi:plastocyanin
MVALVAAGAIGVGVLSGCGSSSGSGQAAGTPSSAAPSSSSSSASSSGGGGMPASATMIMIQSFQYKTPASVSPGATVSVMNMDGEAHTVTADSGAAFDVKSPPGQTVTFTAPSTPGSYPYHCTYHGNMHGVLVVK